LGGNDALQEAAISGRLEELIEKVRKEEAPETAPQPPVPTTENVSDLESIVCEPDPLFDVVARMRDPVTGVCVKDRYDGSYSNKRGALTLALFSLPPPPERITCGHTRSVF